MNFLDRNDEKFASPYQNVLTVKYGNAYVLFFMLVTFGLPILVRFSSNPWFICQYPCVLLRNISSACRRGFLRARCANEGEGGGGSHGWWIIVCIFARKIIMVRDLMCQPEAQCRFPVRLQVLQGTGGLSSADHVWVWPSNHDCDPTINLVSHVQNVFIHFFCHKSSQIFEYRQSYPHYHSIKR